MLGNGRSILSIALASVVIGCAPSVQGESGTTAYLVKASARIEGERSEPAYKGWKYLASRLVSAGIPQEEVARIYHDPRMPHFSFVPFALKPKESSSIYAGFIGKRHFKMGAEFVRRYDKEFDRMERALKVPRSVVTAILVIESQLGANTGNHSVLYRLSRVASVGDPDNVRKNLERLRREENPNITLEQLEDRAKYLEKTFLPEIPYLIEIGKRNKVDVHNVKGSIAGAFGLPQFLPSAFLRYGVDGDQNGHVSLYNEVDAIWSAANYLASFGYRDSLPRNEKRAIIWKYNKSDAYIDTVLSVAKGIEKLSA